MELPKIISVDDHVCRAAPRVGDLAPREVSGAGPKVVRKRWGASSSRAAASTRWKKTPGPVGDAWVYDDELIYVHKRHVAIPESAVAGTAAASRSTAASSR